MNDMKNTNYYNYVILGIYYYYQIFPGSYLPFIDPPYHHSAGLKQNRHLLDLSFQTPLLHIPLICINLLPIFSSNLIDR